MTGSSNSKYRSESNDIAMDVWTDALRNDQCGSVERRGVDSKQRWDMEMIIPEGPCLSWVLICFTLRFTTCFFVVTCFTLHFALRCFVVALFYLALCSTLLCCCFALPCTLRFPDQEDAGVIFGRLIPRFLPPASRFGAPTSAAPRQFPPFSHATPPFSDIWICVCYSIFMNTA